MVEDRVPFTAGDVLSVESGEYPPSVGDGSGYEFWVIDGALRAPSSSGLWLVTGWELAAGTQELVRLRTVCVPASTPRACWRGCPPKPYRDAAEGWAQPTQVLPIVTVGGWMRRGAIGGDRRTLLTRLAARSAAPVAGVRSAGGRHADRRTQGNDL
jgi:hypothetical protein